MLIGTVASQIVQTVQAALWTPASLPGKLAMFDAETLAMTDGASVSSWSDGAVAFEQSAPDNQPIYIKTGQGGKAVVRFIDNDVLFYGGNATNYWRTILIVYSDKSTRQWATPLNNQGYNVAFHGYSDDTQLLSPQYCYAPVYQGLHRRNGVALTPDQMPRPDTMQVFAHVANQSIDLAIGSMGADGAGSLDRAINGDIAFVFIGSTALTTTDIEKFEGWAAHRRGLAGELPPSHPYKASPPVA